MSTDGDATAVDVLCVGFACTDLHFSTPHHPAADEKIAAHGFRLSGGGPAANAAVAIARLGGSARFSGYFGRDPLGDAHLEELRCEGVRLERITRGRIATPIAAVTCKPGGERSIVHYRDPAAMAATDTLSLEQFPARVLLLDGHQAGLSEVLIAEARQRGIPVVLDAGSLHDGTRALYDKVDYLIASATFARELTQEPDPRSALSAMEGMALVTAVTCGADGVYWEFDGAQRHTAAIEIEAVDTTGAGDAFHGAFALGLAQGLDLPANMARANVVGALTCMQYGAREALPRKAQLDRWLRLANAT